MSREIKFRVYDKNENMMLSEFNDGIMIQMTTGRVGTYDDDGNFVEDGYSKPMAFTGVVCKDGDIYEGDILKHNDKLYYVKFSQNQFNLLLKEVKSKTNWRDLSWCNNVGKYISIVGNVYQNPELLG